MGLAFHRFFPYVQRGKASHDPYSWGDRTMYHAHLYIQDHFDEIDDGGVVDVTSVPDEAA